MELLEARTPRNATMLARTAGVVRRGEKRNERHAVYVQPLDDAGSRVGEEIEHLLPPDKFPRVHDGDRVQAGEPLAYGPPDPHEMLKILGRETVQRHLMAELQSIYRLSRVEIDDKHIEVLVAQMLRKVKVETTGDGGFLPGAVVDRFTFQAANDRLERSCKITEAGESGFTAGEIVSTDAFDAEWLRLAGEGKTVPTAEAPAPATCSDLLLGITRAASAPESFLAAATFHDPKRVLTDAALAGRVDRLSGLQENVLLGRLVPAGTGFPPYREATVGMAEPLDE
jgi:DNA-directed RNA polymerase subunit beta'